jgi:hypothetical protein
MKYIDEKGKEKMFSILLIAREIGCTCPFIFSHHNIGREKEKPSHISSISSLGEYIRAY